MTYPTPHIFPLAPAGDSAWNLVCFGSPQESLTALHQRYLAADPQRGRGKSARVQRLLAFLVAHSTKVRQQLLMLRPTTDAPTLTAWALDLAPAYRQRYLDLLVCGALAADPAEPLCAN